MKILNTTAALIILAITFSGCGTNNNKNSKSETEQPAAAVPDTGFTGIKQYRSNQHLIKEVTFRNGVREGLMKTFYIGGQVYQTFWYENGMREDSSCYYYLEGQLFRTTPYKHDTIDGIQKQYYRTGELKARIGYKKGMRTTLFQEFNMNGKLVTGYPGILVATDDQYKKNGTYKIILGISELDTKVRFYRGAIINERFDTTLCKPIPAAGGKYILTLKKSATRGEDHVDVIASVTTGFGNKYIATKKIDLPYNDLN